MAGRLYRMAKVVSANPASWGIVDANQISGFRTVATQADLYSIAACILSSSYGDGTTNGNDAVGQIWHVQDTNKDFRLTSWANRGKAAGWTEELTSESLVGKINAAENKADSAINKANTNTAAITAVKSTANNNALKIKANADSINDLKTAVGKKADSSRVDIIADSVTSNTGDIINIKNTLAEKADLVNGKLDPEQLPDIDTTLYELAPNNTLPSTLADINKNHIYLVKAATTGTNNVYAEYIYTGTTATYDATKWEKLGEVTASVDLSGYYTKTQTDSAIDNHCIDTIKFVGEQVAGSTNLQLGLMEKGGTTIGPETIPEVTSDLNGLMTPALKAKLEGIATGANNYVHPTRFDGAIAIGRIYKFNTDKFGHIGAATPVSKGDITALGIPGETPALNMSAIKDTESVIVRATYGDNNYDANIPSADANNAGVMSVAAWTKLSKIEEGATRNAVVDEVESTGTDAVNGKAVWDHVYHYKIHGDNLGNEVDGSSYTIVARSDNDNTVTCLTDVLTLNYDAVDHSNLVVDNAVVWDEDNLKAITNDELTKILV